MPASSAGVSRRKRGIRKSARGSWTAVVPLLLGILITPFALRSASILALEGPKAFALLYPWVEVLRSRALHLPADLVANASEWMMYLQFPLYGLALMLTWRAGRYLRAFILALILHFTGLVAVVVLAWLGQ
ncbi:MAG TPA: hypothetical protein VHU89_12055 [Acidobacteriaceae bacterium]|jgi:hypothetical protein|nr:hypothetical protein [Acidobacteriaceae bacterium]